MNTGLVHDRERASDAADSAGILNAGGVDMSVDVEPCRRCATQQTLSDRARHHGPRRPSAGNG
jgi:uncharacterized protein YcbX